jgi:hypothetical protein
MLFPAKVCAWFATLKNPLRLDSTGITSPSGISETVKVEVEDGSFNPPPEMLLSKKIRTITCNYV